MDPTLRDKIPLMLAVLAGAVLSFRGMRLARAGRRAITAQELQRRLAEGEDLLVLDVRGRDEFCGELGHVEGAVNLPLPELAGRVAELKDQLGELRRTSIVLTCLRGPRAFKAMWQLEKAGFRHLHVLKGGMVAWHAAALPVSRD